MVGVAFSLGSGGGTTGLLGIGSALGPVGLVAVGAVVVGAIAYDHIEKQEKKRGRYKGNCADHSGERNHA